MAKAVSNCTDWLVLKPNHKKGLSYWASLPAADGRWVGHWWLTAICFKKKRVSDLKIVCLTQTGPAVMERGKTRKEPCRFLPCIFTEKRHQRTEPKSMIRKKYEKITVLPPPHAELEGWPDIQLSLCLPNRNNTADWFKGSALRAKLCFLWLFVLICHAHLSSVFSMFCFN